MTTQAIANTATGVGVMSSASMFVTEHASLIGVTLTALSLIIATTFYILNYRINKKRLLMAIRDGSGALTDSEVDKIRRQLNRRRVDQ